MDSYPVRSGPDGPFIDAHDLVALILEAHCTTLGTPCHIEKPWEIKRDGAAFYGVSADDVPPEWRNAAVPRRVGYVLARSLDSPETQVNEAQVNTTTDTFLTSEGVDMKDGRTAPLTRQEIEDIFLRCKLCDQGFLLAHVAQRVIETLPSIAPIRVRTSQSHTIICKPSDVLSDSAVIIPRGGCAIIRCGTPDAPGGIVFSGFDGPIR